MSSPLGLTTFDNIKYTSDKGDPTTSGFTGKYNSLFNKSKFYYRPNVSTNNSPDTEGKKKDVARGTKTHQGDNNDDIYNISTNSIIEYTQNADLPALTLNGTDFAYLRDLGVYPNNRLLVARRFPSPVENDLTAVKMESMSKIVTWIPDSADNFFTFDLSEEWSKGSTEDPLGDLTDIFNDIFAKGTGINVKKEGSGSLGGIAKLFPMGGIAEALETTITNYLLGDKTREGTNFSYDNLPMGNPNFMGESAFRKMNSIRSNISIPVKVSYEMKFINGIDPSIAYMDILQNLMRFSSSQSVFYISQAGGEKVNSFFNKFKEGKWIEAISLIVDSVINAVSKVINDFKGIVSTIGKAITGDDAKSNLKSSLSKLTNFVGSSALARYRIKFAEIIPAAMGSSSAPWHLTIGNPKNPFFSSGDMIVDGGKVTMGNTLGFNDIPTRLDFEFTIRSARNLGIQEIFDKFNVGAGRQYQRSAIEFRTDFNQGSVNNVNSSDDTTNPATGAAV